MSFVGVFALSEPVMQKILYVRFLTWQITILNVLGFFNVLSGRNQAQYDSEAETNCKTSLLLWEFKIAKVEEYWCQVPVSLPTTTGIISVILIGETSRAAWFSRMLISLVMCISSGRASASHRLELHSCINGLQHSLAYHTFPSTGVV